MFFIKKIRTPHNGRACTRTGARESWSGLATVDEGGGEDGLPLRGVAADGGVRAE